MDSYASLESVIKQRKCARLKMDFNPDSQPCRALLQQPSASRVIDTPVQLYILAAKTANAPWKKNWERNNVCSIVFGILCKPRLLG